MEQSEDVKAYRLLMRVAGGISLAGFALLVMGLMKRVPGEVGVMGGIAGAGGGLFSGYMGWAAHKKVVEERDKQNEMMTLVMMAAQLKTQTDDSLRKIAVKGGPAGQAAALLLQNREAQRAKQSSNSG